MAKTYFVRFSSGNPNLYAGLSPTFVQFMSEGATTLTPPSISELGTSTGLYKFSYAPSPTFAIAFVIDGGAALSSGDRYVVGSMDAVQVTDQSLGFSQDSYGSTAMPESVFGYVKRVIEFLQADNTFNKSTGVWDVYAHGTSTMLMERTLQNSSSQTTKS